MALIPLDYGKDVAHILSRMECQGGVEQRSDII